jgi:very-short-patch-repair endonuclease
LFNLSDAKLAHYSIFIKLFAQIIYTLTIVMKDNRKYDLMQSRPNSELAAQRTLQKLGYTVIAQKKINTGRSTFYADLYIPELRLCIEIDGGYHFTAMQKKKDALRSAAIRRMGMHVYRLKAADAYHPSKIIAKLKFFVRQQAIKK